MKKTLYTLLFLGFVTTTNAMTPPDSTNTILEKGTAAYIIAEGKRLYNEGEFRFALAKFRDALEKDKNNAEATYWIAECHLALGNYVRSAENGEKALELSKEISPDVYFLLGESYHRMANLDKAIENFETAKTKMSAIRVKELMIDFKIAECQRAKEMMKSPVDVKVESLGRHINSPQDEYGFAYSASRKAIYFTSRRSDTQGGGVSSGDDRYFSDIYVCLQDTITGEWLESSNAHEINERLNSNGFDGVGCISTDGGVMLLTVNTMGIPKAKPKTKSSDIYMAKLNNRGLWNTPKPLPKPINGYNFDAAPCFSGDQNTIYFISERPGGKGGSDIYYSTKVGRDWSKPINIEIVNTPEHETTVFVTPDETYLFFSSKGHEGMGGYDVYVSKNIDGEWSEPKNLGYPINTVSDETHFVYYKDMNKAYYSTFSNEENKGKGMRDIFEIDLSNYTWPEW